MRSGQDRDGHPVLQMRNPWLGDFPIDLVMSAGAKAFWLSLSRPQPAYGTGAGRSGSESNSASSTHELCDALNSSFT